MFLNLWQPSELKRILAYHLLIYVSARRLRNSQVPRRKTIVNFSYHFSHMIYCGFLSSECPKVTFSGKRTPIVSAALMGVPPISCLLAGPASTISN
jgi:hypothetical protein